ncbi:MAG: ribosome silencing factor [Blastochloris viridis]|uniref:Ribosomal silencing factor RsfS n=1 Tax=Blastochloris viridis TaxID=1079 RepID=A0A6N4RCI3_BLAVI|nr:MAG: ribosome silencing factor [Blastochloris viridis]
MCHKIVVHAERKVLLADFSLHQGKAGHIAATTAAARVRRTGNALAGRKAGTLTGAAKSGRPKTAAKPPQPTNELERVKAALEDMKAENLLVIPLAGQASFADFLVIASGTSTRHVSSMGRALEDKLGKAILSIEGMTEGEWVCADLGDIVVHLFVPEKRVLYNLEKLWSHVFDTPDSGTE